jgi:BirA family biotin operon repressor/biotin-[acetyl-CoA-carboxylase] ligase
VEQVEFHHEIDSTNDRALELARTAACRYPALVVAEVQSVGRGRGANRWWADFGAVTFSLLIETDSTHLPPRRWPQVSLTAGLAVCEVIEDLLVDNEQAVRLKWPNDVFVGHRKVCGILVEAPPDRPRTIVLGIGINVNNSLSHAPPELQSTAAALCDVAKQEFSLIDVLERVLIRLEERLQWIGSRDDELRSRWRQRCLLTDRTVRIDLGARAVTGFCRGIDEEGALMLETPHGPERCFAGVVTEFR